MALAAYRQLLRSIRFAFQSTCSKTTTHVLGSFNYNSNQSNTCKLSVDDLRVLSAASVEARSNFEQNRYISPSSTEAEQKVLKAKEVARVLRQNVVQGEQVTGSEDKEQRYRA